MVPNVPITFVSLDSVRATAKVTTGTRVGAVSNGQDHRCMAAVATNLDTGEHSVDYNAVGPTEEVVYLMKASIPFSPAAIGFTDSLDCCKSRRHSPVGAGQLKEKSKAEKGGHEAPASICISTPFLVYPVSVAWRDRTVVSCSSSLTAVVVPVSHTERTGSRTLRSTHFGAVY